MADGNFHHGNLRAALINLAVDDLARGATTASLSLRDLAQRVGVSTGAPYRHFTSKDALLRAVAEEGHARVLAAYDAARTSASDPGGRLREACSAYLDLAFGNPGLFDLIFFTDAFSGRTSAPAHEEGSAFAAFEKLVSGAGNAAGPQVDRRVALAIWSLLHGFATLSAHGRIDNLAPRDVMREVILAAAVAMARTCVDGDLAE